MLLCLGTALSQKEIESELLELKQVGAVVFNLHQVK